MDLSWRDMDRHFRGETPTGKIVFSTGTRVEKNLELRRNVKKRITYYAEIFPTNQNDYISKPAPQEIIDAHPHEFAEYLAKIDKGLMEPFDGYGEKEENCALPFAKVR